MRPLTLSLLLFAFGCEAIFTDLTPEVEAPADASLSTDAALSTDAMLSMDAGLLDAGLLDAGLLNAAVDSGPVPIDVGPATPVLLGSGSFEGRGGYPASGNVRLEELSPGEYQVVTSDDFSSAAVPGPVIVITPRADIGTMLGGDDLIVTSLSAERIAGAGTYTFSAASVPDDAYIFIYCQPFGVETARAQLVAP